MELTEELGKERCYCGHPSCKDWWLTGIGKFVQGSGFTEAEADRILAAFKAREPAGDAVERAARAIQEWHHQNGKLRPSFTEAKGQAWTALTAALPELAALRAKLAEGEARVAGLQRASETLRLEAYLLLQNSEGCALNHYGDACKALGMPQWLIDSRGRIDAAAAAILKGASV